LVKSLEKFQEKINSVNIQDEFESDQSSQLSAEDDPFHPEDLKIFKKELAEKQSQFNILTKTDNANKTFEQKQDEKKASKKESWSLIKIIQENLMIYALIDFTL